MNSFAPAVHIGRSRKGDAEQRREVALVCLALPWGGRVACFLLFAEGRGHLLLGLPIGGGRLILIC